MVESWLLDRRSWLIIGIVVNLSVIGFYKYFNFIGNNVAQMIGKPWGDFQILLPLGISFFTFTQTAYLIDAFKIKSAERSLLSYSLFVTIFPHLIAGPIIHYKHVVPQFQEETFGKVTSENLAKGLTLFVVGLFKKMVIADSLALIATPVFAAADRGVSLSYAEAWIGAVGYTFQLYFDFSGYSDMAVGLGWLFGVRLPWNFDSPYKAINIQDFWRRWHITLSFFMRDYVYFPLGGSRRGSLRSYGNLITTMLLCGLWHGANWTFVLWGLLHGVYMVVHRLWRLVISRLCPRFMSADGQKARQLSVAVLMTRSITFLAVVWAWVLFRASTLSSAKELWWAMLGGNGLVLPGGLLERMGYIGNWLKSYGFVAGQIFGKNEILFPQLSPLYVGGWILTSMLIVWLLPNCRELIDNGLFSDKKNLVRSPGFLRERLARGWEPTPLWAGVFILLTVLSIMSLSSISEFLYFQF